MTIRNIIIAALLIVAVLLLIDKCSGGNILRCNRGGQDTVRHSIDTVFTTKVDSIKYVPIPFEVIRHIEGRPVVRTIVKHDTLEIFETMEVDTAAILSDYYATANYNDTIYTLTGHIVIKESISQNRIQNREIHSSVTDTVIRETIVLTQPKKNIVYISASVMGNKNELFNGVGWGLALKTKNDHMYGAEAKILKGGHVFYEAQFKLPIRFKRQKK